jgi:phosphopantothenate-cysteine ligase
MRFLITAGGTRAYIDEVRWLGNVSSGRFGAELAVSALHAGHQVLHFHSERAVSPTERKVDILSDLSEQWNEIERDARAFARVRHRYRAVKFLSLESYQEKLESLLRSELFDVILLAAAVSDYAPTARSGKIPSNQLELVLNLNRVPKTIDRVKDFAPRIYQVGFKLLVGASTSELIAAAEASARHNRSDCIVANDLAQLRESQHTIHLVRPGHPTETYRWDEQPADRLIERVSTWAAEKKDREIGA